jgi:hypothetical protein
VYLDDAVGAGVVLFGVCVVLAGLGVLSILLMAL